jgi:hypothetical protein
VSLASIRGLRNIVDKRECESEELHTEKDAEITTFALRLAVPEKLVGEAEANENGGIR